MGGRCRRGVDTVHSGGTLRKEVFNFKCKFSEAPTNCEDRFVHAADEVSFPNPSGLYTWIRRRLQA